MAVEEPTPPPPIVPGVARALSPLLRRIARAESDGSVGQNTYLVGIDEIVVVDPGPVDADHLGIVCGCGGDRIRWIIMTDADPDNVAGAAELKDRTGAELIGPAGLDGIDDVMGDGYKIDATEFRITAVAVPGGTTDQFCFVIEQERTILVGNHLDNGVPAELPSRIQSYRLKAIAPGRGQYDEAAKARFSG